MTTIFGKQMIVGLSHLNLRKWGVVEEVRYAIKQSNFVVLFVLGLLPKPRSYVVPVIAIQTPSGYG